MVTENGSPNREMSPKAFLKLIQFTLRDVTHHSHMRKFNMCKPIGLNFSLLENLIFENEKTKAEISC